MEIKIKPSKVLFFNDDNFFGIYSCEVNPNDIDKVEINNWGNISIKGVMPKLEIGTEYTVDVKEDDNGKYKGSYIVENIKQDRPETIEDQRSFLEAILTQNQIDNIYDVYGEDEDIVGMIERGDFDYTKVKGIADITFKKLQKKVMDNIDLSEVLSFCNKYGIKYNMIQKLVKEYKNPQIVIQKIEENPYLLTEVKGVGFKKADEIAKSVGYSMTSPHRIDSCLIYCIMEENGNGHSWINYKQLLNKAIELLRISKNHIEDRLKSGVEKIMKIDDRFTLNNIYHSERFIAHKMTQYKTQSKKMFDTDFINKFLDEYCEKHGLELEENQRQFFHDWNENSVLMLVGGGGMGKSYLQKILIELVKIKSLRVALLAPTGKASKVMSGYTGMEASTIHRKAGVFEDESEGVKEITEDVIIIDESSMCDIFILAKFFRSLVNDNARILFVGDDFQLPSVGVGNFLYDVIHSNTIKVSRLKKVFRQADGGILNVATDIREGKHFLNSTDSGRIVFGRDCVFWLTEQDYIRDGVITNYKKVLNSGRWSQDEIVILSPTNKGKLGTVELNKEIQKIANPPSSTKKEKSFGSKNNETIFRVGDLVMNLVNTYDVDTVDGGFADIFNGDTGVIIDIIEDEKVIIVEIDDIQVKIKFGNVLTSLSHSWVTTIHKSQGSQYKVVIMITDKSMTYQLNANLLYTGGSRAKEYELWLAQAETINKAMKKFANMERRSFLQEFLIEFNKDSDSALCGYENIEAENIDKDDENIKDTKDIDGETVNTLFDLESD